MSRIIIRSSRWKNLAYSAVAVGMFIFGWMGLESGRDTVLSWFLAVAGGLGAPIFIYIAFNREPQIIIDQDGVDLVGIGMGRLHWSEISSVYAQENSRRYTYINIELVDPKAVAARKVAAAAAITGNCLVFNADGYEMSGDDIADAMMRVRSGLKITEEQRRVSEVSD